MSERDDRDGKWPYLMARVALEHPDLERLADIADQIGIAIINFNQSRSSRGRFDEDSFSKHLATTRDEARNLYRKLSGTDPWALHPIPLVPLAPVLPSPSSSAEPLPSFPGGDVVREGPPVPSPLPSAEPLPLPSLPAGDAGRGGHSS